MAARHHLPAVIAVLVLAAAPAGCGEDGSGASNADPCRLVETYPSARQLHLTLPLRGLAWGQEIWISYRDKEYTGKEYRYPRRREDALDLARRLCRAVHDGADIGELAREHSNAVGGRALGFAPPVPRPDHRNAPDARDRALYKTPVGELTPLLAYAGGFWFARRITEGRGRDLQALYEKERNRRARARVIHIHHEGAYPQQYEYDGFTKEQAVRAARSFIRQIQAGTPFEELAREKSNDKDSRPRGGLLVTEHPITKVKTEWIRWGDQNFPQPLLDVILEKCPPGTLWHEPVVHGRGVDVVMVLERVE